MIGTVTDEDSVKDAMFEPQTAALPLRVTTTEPRHLHLTNRIYFTLHISINLRHSRNKYNYDKKTKVTRLICIFLNESNTTILYMALDIL